MGVRRLAGPGARGHAPGRACARERCAPRAQDADRPARAGRDAVPGQRDADAAVARPRRRRRPDGQRRRPRALSAGHRAVVVRAGAQRRRLGVPGHERAADPRRPVRRLRWPGPAGAGMALGPGRRERLPEAQPVHPVPRERPRLRAAPDARGRPGLLVGTHRRRDERQPGHAHAGHRRPQRRVRAERAGRPCASLPATTRSARTASSAGPASAAWPAPAWRCAAATIAASARARSRRQRAMPRR